MSVHRITRRVTAAAARPGAVAAAAVAALLPAAGVHAVTAQPAQVRATAVQMSDAAIRRAPLATSSFRPAVQIRLPLNSAAPPAGWLLTDSCPRQGSCAAGGFYYDRHGTGRALIAALRHGTWGRATAPLLLPSDASAKPNATVESMVCSSPGNCVAVGGYGLNSGGSNPFAPFAAAEVRGHWQRARRILVPANAGTADFQASLSGLACTSVGNCVAFGTFFTNAGIHQLMVATQTRGHWARARSISAPGDQAAFGYTQATSLQCPRRGACVAIGVYGNAAGEVVPLSVREINGHWQGATGIGLPSNAVTGNTQFASLPSLACTRTGFCVAVGKYTTASGKTRAMAVTGKNGLSGHATEIAKAPLAAGPDPSSIALTAVSCQSSARCVAVGQFTRTTFSSGAMMSLIRAGGHWGDARLIRQPANALPGSGQPGAVSCTALGYCAMAGSYETKKTFGEVPMAAIMP